MVGMKSTISLSLILTSTLAAAQACTRNATVEVGDNCDIISQKYASSTYQLAISNPTIDDGCSNLVVGENVCLGLSGGDCQKVYEVVSGDTCDGISSKYGLGESTLWSNNPQIDENCWNIYVGEVLCVDTTVFSYSSPATAAATTTSSSSSPTTTTSSTAASSSVSVEAEGDVITSTSTVAETTVYTSAESVAASSSATVITSSASGVTTSVVIANNAVAPTEAASSSAAAASASASAAADDEEDCDEDDEEEVESDDESDEDLPWCD